MRILLDTHLLLWALSQPSRLSPQMRKRIDSAEVYVSTASIWEIGIKSAMGKIAANAGEVLAGLEPAGFIQLAITGEHAAKAAELPPLHKDPFDRILVAQASVEPMLLLTNDEVLRGYGSFVTVG